MKISKFVIPFFVFSFTFSSLFSAPKRAMIVTTIADSADSRFETANNEIVAEKYQQAYNHLSQVYDLALSIDDVDLLCRASLSGISYKIATGNLQSLSSKEQESFLNDTASNILANAKQFANRSKRSSILKSVCEIYNVKLELAFERKNFKVYEQNLKNVEKNLSKQPYYLASLYSTLGDVYLSSKNYSSAVDAFKKAAEIHTKNRYLFEIGNDWYGVARAYSLDNKKQEAFNAMQNALKYDRDSENTSAIASDYFASAKILLKGVPSIDEKKQAKELIKWAAAIYKAGGLKEEAIDCENYLKSLEK